MELTWLRVLLSEINFGLKKLMILFFCDNTIDIEIANDLIQNDPTKHIDLDKNYIKDNLDFDMIKVPYIKNADQLVDMMTYVVTSGAFYVSLSKLGMCDNYVPTWGVESTYIHNCDLKLWFIKLELWFIVVFDYTIMIYATIYC